VFDVTLTTRNKTSLTALNGDCPRGNGSLLSLATVNEVMRDLVYLRPRARAVFCSSLPNKTTSKQSFAQHTEHPHKISRSIVEISFVVYGILLHVITVAITVTIIVVVIICRQCIIIVVVVIVDNSRRISVCC
jgi:hypothetical protein